MRAVCSVARPLSHRVPSTVMHFCESGDDFSEEENCVPPSVSGDCDSTAASDEDRDSGEDSVRIFTLRATHFVERQ